MAKTKSTKTTKRAKSATTTKDEVRTAVKKLGDYHAILQMAMAQTRADNPTAPAGTITDDAALDHFLAKQPESVKTLARQRLWGKVLDRIKTASQLALVAAPVVETPVVETSAADADALRKEKRKEARARRYAARKARKAAAAGMTPATTTRASKSDSNAQRAPVDVLLDALVIASLRGKFANDGDNAFFALPVEHWHSVTNALASVVINRAHGSRLI